MKHITLLLWFCLTFANSFSQKLVFSQNTTVPTINTNQYYIAWAKGGQVPYAYGGIKIDSQQTRSIDTRLVRLDTLSFIVKLKGPENYFGASTWFGLNNTLWMFGGSNLNSTSYNADQYEILTNTNTSNKIELLTHPSARAFANVWEKDSVVYLMGGQNIDALFSPIYYNDLWKYDKVNNAWSSIAASVKPSPRAKASCWFLNNKLYLYGGVGAKGCQSDLWTFDLTTNTWTAIQNDSLAYRPAINVFDQQSYPAENIPARTPGYRSQALTWTWQNSLWLWGGQVSNNQAEPLIWEYDLNSNKWKSHIGLFYGDPRWYFKTYVDATNSLVLLQAPQPYANNSSVATEAKNTTKLQKKP